MDPPSYTITIHNQSGKPHSYLLFAEKPHPSHTATVFSNVYMTSGPVDGNGGTAIFRVRYETYAIAGTHKDEIVPGVNVSTTDNRRAVLALPTQGSGPGEGGSHFFMTGGPDGRSAAFDDGRYLKDGAVPPGCFSITCGTDFQIPNSGNQFIGLGGPDPEDASNVLPIAVMPAVPGITRVFMPLPSYYVVAWKGEKGGEVIDASRPGEGQQVDFTAGGYDSATLTNSTDGGWTVRYH